jgi:hypothetical protein
MITVIAAGAYPSSGKNAVAIPKSATRLGIFVGGIRRGTRELTEPALKISAGKSTAHLGQLAGA